MKQYFQDFLAKKGLEKLFEVNSIGMTDALQPSSRKKNAILHWEATARKADFLVTFAPSFYEFARELSQKASECGLSTNSVGVPFLWDGKTCLVGDADVIDFFRKRVSED